MESLVVVSVEKLFEMIFKSSYASEIFQVIQGKLYFKYIKSSVKRMFKEL